MSSNLIISKAKLKSVPVLSIKQPYAWLIANGYQNILNSARRTNYTGEVLLRAQELSQYGYKKIVEKMSDIKMPSAEKLQTNGIIGIAKLKEVLPPAFFQKNSKLRNTKKYWENVWYKNGFYAFLLSNPRRLSFLSCSKTRRFFLFQKQIISTEEITKNFKEK